MKNISSKAISVLAIILMLAPITAGAAQLRGEANGSVSINQAVTDDLYAAGSSVSIVAPVTGDAVLAGGNIFVSGPIDESVWAVGGTVTIAGNVADDVRAAGGNVMINAAVAHDVIVLGGQIDVSSSASIGRDLVVLGGEVTINGPVNGNLIVRGGDVTVNAPIKGSVDASVSTLSFGPQASINGKLTYSSPTEASIGPGVALGGVQYNKAGSRDAENPRDALAILFTIGFLIKLVTMFVLALIMAAVFKKRVWLTAQSAFVRFGANLLWGFAALFLVPIASFFLLVSIVGAPLGIIGFCAYGILLMLVTVLAPILVGSWIWKFIKKTKDYPVNTWSILVGTVVYGLIALVPLVGWIFGLVFMLVSLGVLSQLISAAVQNAENGK